MLIIHETANLLLEGCVYGGQFYKYGEFFVTGSGRHCSVTTCHETGGSEHPLCGEHAVQCREGERMEEVEVQATKECTCMVAKCVPVQDFLGMYSKHIHYAALSSSI